MLRIAVIIVVLLVSFPAYSVKRKLVSDSGPDLPYTCEQIRAAIQLKGIDFLKSTQEYKKLTEQQRSQAAKCTAKKSP